MIHFLHNLTNRVREKLFDLSITLLLMGLFNPYWFLIIFTLLWECFPLLFNVATEVIVRCTYALMKSRKGILKLTLHQLNFLTQTFALAYEKLLNTWSFPTEFLYISLLTILSCFVLFLQSLLNLSSYLSYSIPTLLDQMDGLFLSLLLPNPHFNKHFPEQLNFLLYCVALFFEFELYFLQLRCNTFLITHFLILCLHNG